MADATPTRSAPARPGPAVTAIAKVEKVRTARQDRFYEARMSRSRVHQKAADRRQLEQEIHLVKAPGALSKEKAQKLKGECLPVVGGWAEGRLLWVGGRARQRWLQVPCCCAKVRRELTCLV